MDLHLKLSYILQKTLVFACPVCLDHILRSYPWTQIFAHLPCGFHALSLHEQNAKLPNYVEWVLMLWHLEVHNMHQAGAWNQAVQAVVVASQHVAKVW